jgi:hypothetical protein
MGFALTAFSIQVSCESKLNPGLPQMAKIPRIPTHPIQSVFIKQTIEELYQSVIIGEICGKKAFLWLNGFDSSIANNA